MGEHILSVIGENKLLQLIDSKKVVQNYVYKLM